MHEPILIVSKNGRNRKNSVRPTNNASATRRSPLGGEPAYATKPTPKYSATSHERNQRTLHLVISTRTPSSQAAGTVAGSLNLSFIKMIWSRSEKNDIRLYCVIGASPGWAP